MQEHGATAALLQHGAEREQLEKTWSARSCGVLQPGTGDTHRFKFKIAAADGARHLRRRDQHTRAGFARRRPGNVRDRYQYTRPTVGDQRLYG